MQASTMQASRSTEESGWTWLAQLPLPHTRNIRMLPTSSWSAASAMGGCACTPHTRDLCLRAHRIPPTCNPRKLAASCWSTASVRGSVCVHATLSSRRWTHCRTADHACLQTIHQRDLGCTGVQPASCACRCVMLSAMEPKAWQGGHPERTACARVILRAVWLPLSSHLFPTSARCLAATLLSSVSHLCALPGSHSALICLPPLRAAWSPLSSHLFPTSAHCLAATQRSSVSHLCALPGCHSALICLPPLRAAWSPLSSHLSPTSARCLVATQLSSVSHLCVLPGRHSALICFPHLCAAWLPLSAHLFPTPARPAPSQSVLFNAFLALLGSQASAPSKGMMAVPHSFILQTF